MGNDEHTRWVEVAMRHPDPRALPEPALPNGTAVRWHGPGDDAIWLAVQNATGVYGRMGGEVFEREFGFAPAELPSRQCFAVDSHGGPVGTATAWFGPAGPEGPDARLHWVAVTPPVQRRGLGRALTLVACRRALELGHRGVYLTTGSGNHPALSLYASLGFEPWPRSPAERVLWADLRPGDPHPEA